MAASITRGAIATLALVTLGACAEVKDHKGYIVDNSLINTVQPGIDNKDSVTKVLGRPTFDSQFDNSHTWFYLSRATRSLAFATPKATEQMLLAVRFTPTGEVASVQRTGLETIRDVSPYSKKTPVLGSHHTFFSELFGNIAAGTTDKASTADNPGG